MEYFEEALKVLKEEREKAGQAFLGVVQFNVPQYYAVVEALEKQIMNRDKLQIAKTKIHAQIMQVNLFKADENFAKSKEDIAEVDGYRKGLLTALEIIEKEENKE